MSVGAKKIQDVWKQLLVWLPCSEIRETYVQPGYLWQILYGRKSNACYFCTLIFNWAIIVLVLGPVNPVLICMSYPSCHTKACAQIYELVNKLKFLEARSSIFVSLNRFMARNHFYCLLVVGKHIGSLLFFFFFFLLMHYYFICHNKAILFLTWDGGIWCRYFSHILKAIVMAVMVSANGNYRLYAKWNE